MELLKVKVDGQWVEIPSIKGEKGDQGDAFTYADFTEAQKTELIQGPIQTAQNAAVQAVQTKGEEVLEAIPDDYEELQQAMEDTVIVAPTQPQSEDNKLWIKEGGEEEYTIPTYEEFTEVKSAFNELPDIYAKQDGTYEDLTAGNALEVLSDRGTNDTEPYLFRKAVGWNRAKLNAVTGGTVAWNQLVGQLQSFAADASGVTVSYDTTTKVLTLNGTSTGRVTFAIYTFRDTITSGHVYLMVNGYTTMHLNGDWSLYSDPSKYCTIAKATTNASNNPGVTIETLSSGKAFDNVNFIPQLINLTKVFGADIAEYIYNLETATPGAGVALFRSWFPNNYYEYNPGELISVSGLQSRETVGFNQIPAMIPGKYIGMSNGAEVSGNAFACTDYVPLIPGNLYYFLEGDNNVGEWGAFYDKDKNFVRGISLPGKSTFMLPSGAAYFRITVRIENIDKTCINLSDPSRNGTYKPYVKHSYPLDSSLTLRGIPKLDSNNKMYFDGDRYLPDGTVERRYGIVDLGTLEWVKHNIINGSFVSILPNSLKNALVCSKYNKYGTDANIANIQNQDKVICINYNGSSGYFANGVLIIIDTSFANNTANEFKTAMEGQYLVYELQTPGTETAEPYRNLQIQEKGGTEAFVSNAELPIPVGHETFYPINIFDYIDQAIAAALNS